MKSEASKPNIVVIVGPTASGKSDLGVLLAKKFSGEVISADSRQVYKGLDIGTGKITKKDMSGVPHHLLDVADPKRVFTVIQFKKKSEQVIRTILKKGKLPIICGGTGFYIDTLVFGKEFPEVAPNKTLRAKLEKKSTAELFEILKKEDPTRAETIDKYNRVRLIRALEIIDALGAVPEMKLSAPYNPLFIGIAPNQELLRKKIHIRLLKRIRQGMIKEAEKLHQQGLSFKRMEALGLEYKYLSLLLQKKISRKVFEHELEGAIWEYTKRQYTWFKKNKSINWFTDRNDPKIIETVAHFLSST